MEYTTLGSTNITVSRLGFGGAPAGLTNYLDDYSPTDASQRSLVISAIHKAVELGITYFDTAPGYGDGQGESIFGEALADVDAPVFVATKVSPDRASDVRSSVEASLQRLRREQIDLLQIHGGSYSEEFADSVLADGGALDQMTELRDQGLIRLIGFTSEDQNPAVYRFIDSGRFDVMQCSYNLVFQHPAEFTRPFGSLYEAKDRDMGTVTMRTLTSGIFQRWVRIVNPENTFDYNPALLQFVLSNPLVDVALVGMRTPVEVEANVLICDDRSSRVDLSDLHRKYP